MTMKVLVCAFVASLGVATAGTAQAQDLHDLLVTMVDHAGRSGDEADTALSDFNLGYTADGCDHLHTSVDEAEAASSTLDAIQTGLNDDTSISDADRADWQSHIDEARGNMQTLLTTGHNKLADLCS